MPKVVCRMRAAGLALIALAVVLASAGCTNRDEYVRHNEALLRTVPTFPAATQKKISSASYCVRDGLSQETWYTTNIVYSVPRGTADADVIRFYRARLEPRGWTAETEAIPGIEAETGRTVSTTLVASFKRADALVSVNTDNMTVRTDIPKRRQHIAGTYELVVDYRGAVEHDWCD